MLGIVGALVGGFLASVLFNGKPIDGPLDISSIVVATIGAIITVLVVGAFTGRSRTGRGPSDRRSRRPGRPTTRKNAHRAWVGVLLVHTRTGGATCRHHRIHRRRRPGPDGLRPVDPVRGVPAVHGGRRAVDQLDDTHLHWVAKVAGKAKEWEAEITEQTPDQRVAWTSTSGAQNAGVVTFHRLDDDTTRVTVQMDVEPEGPVETVGTRSASPIARSRAISSGSRRSSSRAARRPARGGRGRAEGPELTVRRGSARVERRGPRRDVFGPPRPTGCIDLGDPVLSRSHRTGCYAPAMFPNADESLLHGADHLP